MEALSACVVIAKRVAEATVVGPAALELQRLSVAVEVTYCDPTSNSALCLDLDGHVAMGRLTWWADGSIALEALRISDGATLMSQHANAATAADAAIALRELARVMVGLPSNNSFKPNPLSGSA